MAVKKIAVTGGPCAGKSSALAAIKAYAEEKGYAVFLLKECATDLMDSGITPRVCGMPLDFQLARVRMQADKEAIYAAAAETVKKDVLIVCDRGLADGKAYMTQENWEACLADIGFDEREVLLSYDAVFYLTSAAVGAVSAYTCDNNAARSETASEAAVLDRATLAAWEKHPCLYKIGCYPTFDEKKEKILALLDAFLKQHKP